MSTGTGIEWTEATWTPVKGCTRVSPGCDNCYAATMTHRLGAMGQSKYAGLTVLNPRGERHFNGVVRCDEEALTVPLRWRKPRRVFVSSMSDIFHKDVPFEFIDRIFAVMALCPRHTFQVLTKRPERMAEYLNTPDRMDRKIWEAMVDRTDQEFCEDHEPGTWPRPNVWFGTSVEDQARADERITHLLRCPAVVHFLSCEPLLGPIDLRRVPNTSPPMPGCPNGAPSRRIEWAIVGGESGHGARPCAVGWIRDIIAQCAAAQVACFVKQLGAVPVGGSGPISLTDKKGGDPAEWDPALRVRQFPT